MPISHLVYAQQNIPGVVASIGKGEPIVRDPNLKIETVATGLMLPTTIVTSGDIEPNGSGELSFRPNMTGTFQYHCEYHPDTMRGIIEVS